MYFKALQLRIVIELMPYVEAELLKCCLNSRKHYWIPEIH